MVRLARRGGGWHEDRAHCKEDDGETSIEEGFTLGNETPHGETKRQEVGRRYGSRKART